MTDKFTCCPIDRLLEWILAEEKTGQLFGIHKDLFFVPEKADPFKISRYGQTLETPIGIAAGPHTQLSQNIISAWLTGARYIELKTVQTLDELDVTKPCIDMTDEGYNCEWSQELKLDQSFSEYLNAWIIIHLLKDKFGWGDYDTPGFIFNMSVGYNLEGILSPNVQLFLSRMEDCGKEKELCIKKISKIYPRIMDLDIPDRISNNLTISTMHGCPPDEIEKIARYFIKDRRLNTTIKLNPTLLGPERLRYILNDCLGYNVEVPDLAFDHDLKYDAGVSLIRTLLKEASSEGLSFNLKLTNTLETTNLGQNLPDNEKMVYMSGRALHPISINLAQTLQKEFDGKLDISFSAGSDCFNIPDILACNIAPITVCSDILKPGGYGRMSQYIEHIKSEFKRAEAKSLNGFIKAQSKRNFDSLQDSFQNLERYSESVINQKQYHKSIFPFENIKTERELTVFDCAKAPCTTTCPANQDVPRYMYHTARGEYEDAWRTILETNPFPNVQGMVCDQQCQTKCTRMNFDNPLLIREIKLFVAQQHNERIKPVSVLANGISVAVIGAGPSGLSCAHFLALNGFSVDIYEAKMAMGGMAADCIPLFRLDEESLKKDISKILSLGVKVHLGEKIDAERFEQLRETYDYIYIAVGAQKAVELGIPGDDAKGAMDQLSFLSAVRRGEQPELGNKVVVIGGGNSAIDSARTARRLVGENGKVSILYRRTRKEMPADHEEIQAAMEEGIELIELAAPECMIVEEGRVTSNVCFRMELGDKDDSGRARPIKVEGSEFHVDADNVIYAIGQQVDLDFFPEKSLEVDPDTFETILSNVFAGGDAIRGASSLIKAIADGKEAARSIMNRSGSQPVYNSSLVDRKLDMDELKFRQARRIFSQNYFINKTSVKLDFSPGTEALTEENAKKEAQRCLQCDLMCNICTTVCPNRANISYLIEPRDHIIQKATQTGNIIQVQEVGKFSISQNFQILNIGDFCNECGNCSTFCPTNGEPYRVKPKFYITVQGFDEAEHGYMLTNGTLRYKNEKKFEVLSVHNDGLIYETVDITAILNPGTFGVKDIRFKTNGDCSLEMDHAVQMGILHQALRDFYLFR